ncbi:LysR family transcriptional regulator [Devosia ginsengisoli]|uniref:LysR family transcriptional regulator n=1 Tax=Devosia ginsengisoli TaxID=400770 RepID=A0A5B8LSC9_9HYPH|nr:LysR family transcriptional regulator [Devosia ginsengisoli]QDZ11168.1 LysR family transcriptional regulator [Devosia ginsengisoli]
MRDNISDLQAFIAVARDRSFTRAAARLGVSQSALSRTIGKLEERLGLRLLARSTRSVAPTEAGERLLQSVTPRLDEVAAELEALTELREKPAGIIRLNAAEHAFQTALWPRLDGFLRDFPDIRIDISLENALTDIVAGRFDAGIRLGELVARDMIAVRIGPDWRLAVVATPAYFATHAPPQTPHDIAGHTCINLRLDSYGGYYAWEFDENGRRLNVRVEGQLAFNSTRPILTAALAGHGLACVPEDMARPHLDSGELVEVLAEYCPTFTGYHLYYPSRRQASPAFTALLDALRYRP